MTRFLMLFLRECEAACFLMSSVMERRPTGFPMSSLWVGKPTHFLMSSVMEGRPTCFPVSSLREGSRHISSCHSNIPDVGILFCTSRACLVICSSYGDSAKIVLVVEICPPVMLIK